MVHFEGKPGPKCYVDVGIHETQVDLRVTTLRATLFDVVQSRHHTKTRAVPVFGFASTQGNPYMGGFPFGVPKKIKKAKVPQKRLDLRDSQTPICLKPRPRSGFSPTPAKSWRCAGQSRLLFDRYDRILKSNLASINRGVCRFRRTRK